MKEIPGVQSAGITDALPLGRNRTWGAGAKGVTYERGRSPFAFPRMVSDGYFAAMGIPVRAGRDFTPADTLGGEPVMIVNETMARALWPGQDPLGKYVLGACAKERKVVGVVGDVRHLALKQTSGNEMYIPMRQCGDLLTADLVVRSTLPPAQTIGAVRAALLPRNLPAATSGRAPVVDKSVSPAGSSRYCGGRRVRANPRVARDLQADLLLRQSAHPEWHPRASAARSADAHRLRTLSRRDPGWRSAPRPHG